MIYFLFCFHITNNHCFIGKIIETEIVYRWHRAEAGDTGEHFHFLQTGIGLLYVGPVDVNREFELINPPFNLKCLLLKSLCVSCDGPAAFYKMLGEVEAVKGAVYPPPRCRDD